MRKHKVRDFLADASAQKKLHLNLAIFWAVNLPIVVFMYFVLPDVWQAASILYLAIVSIYANFVGEISSWQAAKVEVRQEEIESARQDELVDQTEEIVEKVNKIPPNDKLTE